MEPFKLFDKLKGIDSLFVLRICCSLVFLGRGIQHLFWDPPYRSLLWDQDTLSPLIEGVFGIPWVDYVTSPLNDSIIQSMIFSIGVFFIFCSLLSLLLKSHQRTLIRVYLLGNLMLFGLALLYFKSRFYQWGQLIEYASQVGAPLLLVYSLRYPGHKIQLLFAKALVALTFLGHGLYAVGYYPVPGKFIDMTVNILQVSENTALSFLFVAGILDFLVVIGLFFRSSLNWALLYAMTWGFLTAMARPVAHVQWDFLLASLGQWTFEAIYRAPHFMIPFWILLQITQTKRFSSLSKYLRSPLEFYKPAEA